MDLRRVSGEGLVSVVVSEETLPENFPTLSASFILNFTDGYLFSLDLYGVQASLSLYSFCCAAPQTFFLNQNYCTECWADHGGSVDTMLVQYEPFTRAAIEQFFFAICDSREDCLEAVLRASKMAQDTMGVLDLALAEPQDPHGVAAKWSGAR